MLASKKSHIIGDVVINYQKFASGKQAILFASDTTTGHEMEAKFRAAGITAKLLTAETPDKDRLDAMIDFREKRIKVLLNVDLFDEGLDVPGIECVIHARPTKSLSKYRQMNGRGLRPAAGKDFLIIIDHVGNVTEHGLPCDASDWTLDRIVRRRDKTNFIRICSNVECNAPYDRTLITCPWCGTDAIIGSNGGGGGGRVPPRQVDGDLFLMDPDTIRELEEKAILADPAIIGKKVGFATNNKNAGTKAMKDQLLRIETQKELALVIARWAGKMKHYGYSDRQINKRFYLTHDKTISECLAEPRADMLVMMDQIKD